MAATFYWHDYETWGSRPAYDRPCQFAGLRTDAALNETGEPLVVYCRPADDLLPQPEACLVTGITPEVAAQKGVPEAEFARAIQRELSRPGTCSVGYNNLRFDDQVTRWLFYRNLLDPYAHAWRNQNSRWDLIDVMRLAHALRPEGVRWPEREPGVASFKLEDLTAANEIEHQGAHDALADVRATLALARRLRGAQPRLFAYALKLRNKRQVEQLIEGGKPLLHVSQRYPAALGCIAPVAVVGRRRADPNGILCFDLREDPAQILDSSDEELRLRLFTARSDLPEGVERLPVKGVRINAAPILVPMGTLGGAAAERWSIDLERVALHAQRAAQHRAAIARRLEPLYADAEASDGPQDPEQMLYAGGFFPDADRREMERLGAMSPEALAREHPEFEDERLPVLLFRMRARSWPATLSAEEREEWDALRFDRLTDPAAGGSITIDAYQQRLAELSRERRDDPRACKIIERLQAWGERIMSADT
jgi:exodeoxyribonuclease-1